MTDQDIIRLVQGPREPVSYSPCQVEMLDLLQDFKLVFPVVSVILLFKWWYSGSSKPPYPPGPRPSLISGNSKDLTMTLPWLKYTELAKQYGNIVHLRNYNEHIVIVNTLEDAIALFEKRSRVYSDRPAVLMIEMMGWDFNTALVQYGDKWRRHRKLFQQNFTKAMVQKTQEPTQIAKIHEFLNNLLVAPDDIMTDFRTLAAGIVMATVYDSKISHSEVERFANISEIAVVKLGESFFPGAVIANAFPILRYLPGWFPGAGFKRFGMGCKVYTEEMQNVPFQYVKEQMDAGIEVSSLTARLLQQKTEDPTFALGEAEGDIKAVAATGFAASAAGTFLYAMVSNLEAQKKAQEEIDAVIGNKRLPNFSDRESMPYLEAVFREVMRWHPMLPLCISHATSEDDIYNGYLIPK
ncbi:hypothetical protein C0991_000996, partial [Blastosporella zonata]